MSTHRTTTPPTHARRLLALAGLGALLSLGLAACQDERSDEPPHQFLPDMDDSPKFKPQMETDFFADGRAMRPHVKGAVAFGDYSRADEPMVMAAPAGGGGGDETVEWRPDRSRARYLRTPVELWEGTDPAGKPLAPGEPAYVKMVPPAALDEFRSREAEHGRVYTTDAAAMKAMILRGQERFNIYCSVCHGFKGEGSDPANFTGGIVGRRWKSPVPNYHDPKYSDKSVKTGQDGYIFSVIRGGVPETVTSPDGKVEVDQNKPPKMPSYADKVNEIDAWAVVLYVRTLQEAWKEPPAPAPAKTPAAKEARP